MHRKGIKKIQLEDKMRRDMNCNFTAWLRQFWNSVNDLSCTLEQVSLLNYSKVLAATYAGVILRCSYCKNMNVSCGESAGQLCVLFLWCFYSYHHKQVFNVTSVKYHLIVTEAQDMFPFLIINVLVTRCIYLITYSVIYYFCFALALHCIYCCIHISLYMARFRRRTMQTN